MRIHLRRRVSPRYEELVCPMPHEPAHGLKGGAQVAFYQWRQSLTKPSKLGGFGRAIL
jgi:hypothetical protein